MEIKKRLIEPFYYPGNSVGCLLIHGFSGSPSEMILLGERLAACGYTVLGIRLSGHGTTPEELSKTGWKQWTADVERGVKQLRECCTFVVAVGLSMGGLLALHLAESGLVDAVASLNAPIRLKDWRISHSKFYRSFLPYVGKGGEDVKVNRVTLSEMAARSESPAVRIQDERFSYDIVPSSALASLVSGIKAVRKRLNLIVCPTLLMQSMKDETVWPISAEIIKNGIGKVSAEVVQWQNSGHLLTMGQERELVAVKVGNFIGQVSGHISPPMA